MGPNGKQAYDKRLSGMGLTLGKCYKKAGEVCPEGYLIVGQNSSTAVTSYNGSFTALPKHKLTIECRSSVTKVC